MLFQELKVTSFEAWWDLYPRKVGRKAAEKAFAKALKDGASIDQLMDAVDYFRHTEAGKKGKFVPYPATWLNQGRHLDDRSDWGEYSPPVQQTKSVPTTTDFEMWRAGIIRRHPELRQRDDAWFEAAWQKMQNGS